MALGRSLAQACTGSSLHHSHVLDPRPARSGDWSPGFQAMAYGPDPADMIGSGPRIG